MSKTFVEAWLAASEFSEPKRIVSDPLRFKGEFFVDDRFLFSFTILLVGLLLGALSGQYFYRERYLIGSALIGCGWCCGLIAWWLDFGGRL